MNLSELGFEDPVSFSILHPALFSRCEQTGDVNTEYDKMK
jgi:hypothetical protein